MAVDTAEKRISALKYSQAFLFGTVPSGTVDRYAALWAYSGISAVSAVPTHTIAWTINGPLRALDVNAPGRSSTQVGPQTTFFLEG